MNTANAADIHMSKVPKASDTSNQVSEADLRSAGVSRGRRLGEQHPEGGALSRSRQQLHLAAVRSDQGPDDGQPEARAP